jgi:predicted ATPase
LAIIGIHWVLQLIAAIGIVCDNSRGNGPGSTGEVLGNFREIRERPDAWPRAQAPSWLAQMPSLWTRSERGVLEARGPPTRERMMRELALAIEALSSDVSLLLKLEDIHWSDASTLDWLAHVARRQEPARLMVLATFRSAEVAADQQSLGDLVTELALHGCCSEIALKPLSLEAIETYLKARLGDEDSATQPPRMAPVLLERTGGNPLFMTSIVNQLAQPEASERTLARMLSIPHDVRRFIDRQIDELNETDRNLLTAASVIRREFATPAVAAALEIDSEQVEATCARLARRASSSSNPDRALGRMARTPSSISSGMISTANCCTTACRRRGAP